MEERIVAQHRRQLGQEADIPGPGSAALPGQQALDRRGDIAGVEPAEQSLIVPGLPNRTIEWRLNHPWADCVHTDAVGTEVLGNALGKVDVGSL